MIQAAVTRMPGLALILLMQALPLAAQQVRDPTVAPTETGSTVLSPMGIEGMSVLVRDDKPYLVVGTRLYAPGDKVGNLRVERISETEVWLHDGTSLTKVPRFAGINRKTVVAKPLCGGVAPTPSTGSAVARARKKSKASQPAVALNPSPAVAPCEDTQP